MDFSSASFARDYKYPCNWTQPLGGWLVEKPELTETLVWKGQEEFLQEVAQFHLSYSHYRP